jgi:hypothetical protein
VRRAQGMITTSISFLLAFLKNRRTYVIVPTIEIEILAHHLFHINHQFSSATIPRYSISGSSSAAPPGLFGIHRVSVDGDYSVMRNKTDQMGEDQTDLALPDGDCSCLGTSELPHS